MQNQDHSIKVTSSSHFNMRTTSRFYVKGYK